MCGDSMIETYKKMKRCDYGIDSVCVFSSFQNRIAAPPCILAFSLCVVVFFLQSFVVSSSRSLLHTVYG